MSVDQAYDALGLETGVGGSVNERERQTII